jgi:tetratricopeptide (TPR) repeat protein
MELEYPSGVAAKEDKVDQNAAPEPRLKKVGLVPQNDLLDQIRKGYDKLLCGQKRGTILPQVEIDVIEKTLNSYHPDRHPRDLLAFAFFSLGRCFTELDDESAAEFYYRQSLACDPRDVRARYNVGNILLRRGEKDAAVEKFQLVVNADPNNSFALRNLTYALAQSGKLKSAIEVAATMALAATDPAATTARLLELCAYYNGWKLARSLVEGNIGFGACAVGAHRAPTRAARASAKDFAERSVSNMKHPSPPEALKFYLETGRW